MGKPRNCLFGQTAEARGHPYALRCCLPKDHGGDHDLRPAHRLLWERFYDEPPPARVASLRPIDGNWLNLKMSNWEKVSAKKLKQERDLKNAPKGKRYCKSCDGYLPLEAFPEKRKTCTSCYNSLKSKSVIERNAHVAEFACEMYQGHHYHMTNRADVIRLWMTQFCDELRKKYPKLSSYRLAVHRYRTQLHSAVESGGKETPDA